MFRSDAASSGGSFPADGARFDELRTPRLLMRRWLPEDLPLFARMNADPEVMRYFPALRDEAESNALVGLLEARFETQGFGLWAIERLAEGDFIGFTGLNPLPPGTPGGDGMEVGWRLAAHAWGHGYATEAARAALDVGLVEVGLPEIWSITAVLNQPSQAVMARVGMQRHADFDHLAVPVGHPLRPHVIYRIGIEAGRVG